MLNDSKVFSSYSVTDVKKAKQFYSEVLGLKVNEQEGMGLELQLDGCKVFLYPKDGHQAASFTVLNFEVGDIDKAVTDLSSKGISFEHYDNMDFVDWSENNVARMKDPSQGPAMAWFKDPDGNILALMQL